MRVRTQTPPAIIIGIIIASLIACGAAWRILTPQPSTVAFANAATAGPATAINGMNPAMIYQSRIAGVATIDSVYGTEHVGGTGFVANDQGYILTASHV